MVQAANNVRVNARILNATRFRIRTGEGPVTARFRLLDETGVLVLLESFKSYPVGTVFVPNRELARISPNKTTHMAYAGLYEAFRGGKHTVRCGGALPALKHGEVQELKGDIETARSYVRVLLASGILTSEEEAIVLHAERALIERLRPKRNEHKVTARAQFLRGMEKRDSLGRVNPWAAGFVTGAAIGHLLERQEDVRRITGRVDKRTIAIWSDVDRHMDLYDELRAALAPARPFARNGAPDLQDPFLRLEFLLDPARGQKAMKVALSILDGFAQSFALVKALPFRTNAEYTRLDLLDAVSAAELRDRMGLRAMFTRLRRGIAWVYAQRALELHVIAPLSFLMEDVSRAERARLRREGRQVRHPVLARREMAPERFAKLEEAWKEFHVKLAMCSDEGLKQPVKARVKDLLTQSRAAARGDNWEEAKHFLKAASALM
ncbi:MAG TPA: hypothetical protein VN397_00620 [Candidatus Methylomirabilis sp.]|nr:hypothetical protein [Candidatus Methylomirabilis sp.]